MRLHPERHRLFYIGVSALETLEPFSDFPLQLQDLMGASCWNLTCCKKLYYTGFGRISAEDDSKVNGRVWLILQGVFGRSSSRHRPTDSGAITDAGWCGFALMTSFQERHVLSIKIRRTRCLCTNTTTLKQVWSVTPVLSVYWFNLR